MIDIEQKKGVLARMGYSIVLKGGHWTWASTEAQWVGWCATANDAWESAWLDLIEDEEIYLHKKGGIYRKLYDARHADGDDVVVYEHLWPHDRGVWVRRKEEFEGRSVCAGPRDPALSGLARRQP